jgi:hypothetical protein
MAPLSVRTISLGAAAEPACWPAPPACWPAAAAAGLATAVATMAVVAVNTLSAAAADKTNYRDVIACRASRTRELLIATTSQGEQWTPGS